MRVLWLTNISLPEASKLMDEDPLSFGGWLVNMSKYLSYGNDIVLSIAFPKPGINDLRTLQGEIIKYYIFPVVDGKDISSIKENKYLKSILDDFKPDIVHIFGTEYPHSLAMVNLCEQKNVNTIINIQGLVSVIAQHYMTALPLKVQKRFTIRDFIKQDNLIQQQQKFIKRGKFEIEALKKVSHVIGRTTWDKACTSQINPNAQYHYCNETLRDDFYNYTWDLKKCERYSIFVSQGSYPVKGLHIMLEAMPIILKKFPKTRLYIGGPEIPVSGNIKQKVKTSSYALYIKELIKKHNLKKYVYFTGLLDEKKMCQRYVSSNVFVCPSIIENSPNSLGEAMILGVPCVASNVGGVTDMLKHKEEGYIYQPDAPYMLAHYVTEIFENEKLALYFSENARKHALKTHNRSENADQLLKIYKKVINV